MKHFYHPFFSSFKFYVILMFSLISFCCIHPSNTLASSPLQTQLLAGTYRLDNDFVHYQPLLLRSNNLGQSWSFTLQNDITLPPSSSLFGLYETSCNDHTCIAIGSYLNQQQKELPLLLMSKDNGTTWSYVQNIQNFPAISYAPIWGIACSNQICAAVGDHRKLGSHINYPYIINSLDQGQSWFYIENIQNLPLLHNSNLLEVHCASNRCAAVGQYFGVENSTRPFLITTHDQGKTWSYKQSDLIYKSNQAAYYQNTFCNPLRCISVGNIATLIDKDSALFDFEPLLSIGEEQDNEAWTTIKDIANLPSDMRGGQLFAIHCNNETCLAAGRYYNDEIVLPLILRSEDYGKHWTAIKTTQGLPNSSETDIFNVYCHDQFCLASGRYTNGPQYLPIVLYSNDKGLSWASSITFSGLPKTFNNIDLGLIHCQEKICSLAGGYSTGKYDDIVLPLLAISQDQGQSWSIIPTDSIPNFPKISFGYFNGRSITNETSLRFKRNKIKLFHQQTIKVQNIIKTI